MKTIVITDEQFENEADLQAFINKCIKECVGFQGNPVEEVPNYYEFTTSDWMSLITKSLGSDCNVTAKKVLKGLDKNHPGAVMSIVLQVIAKALDSYYPDHISKSEAIYIVNSLNGKVQKVDKKVIRNYQYFAAFRTLDDAVHAVKTFNTIKQSLYVQ
jgi:hypothetical protein